MQKAASSTVLADTAPEAASVTQSYELVAELLGTFLIVFLGCGVVATVHMQQTQYAQGAAGQQETTLMINLGWGSAVAFAVICSFEASGAQLNPAVTLSNVIFSGMSPMKAIVIVICQFVGAFLGAWLVTLQFMSRDGSTLTNFLYTAPAEGFSWPVAFCYEVLCTALLLIGINYVAHAKPAPKGLLASSNSSPNKIVMASFVGFLVFTIGTCVGQCTGYAMNPARDIAPRLVFSLYSLMSDHPSPWANWTDAYFVVPLLAPLIGGPLGTMIYKLTSGPTAQQAEDLQAPLATPAA